MYFKKILWQKIWVRIWDPSKNKQNGCDNLPINSPLKKACKLCPREFTVSTEWELEEFWWNLHINIIECSAWKRGSGIYNQISGLFDLIISSSLFTWKCTKDNRMNLWLYSCALEACLLSKNFYQNWEYILYILSIVQLNQIYAFLWPLLYHIVCLPVQNRKLKMEKKRMISCFQQEYRMRVVKISTWEWTILVQCWRQRFCSLVRC